MRWLKPRLMSPRELENWSRFRGLGIFRFVAVFGGIAGGGWAAMMFPVVVLCRAMRDHPIRWIVTLSGTALCGLIFGVIASLGLWLQLELRYRFTSATQRAGNLESSTSVLLPWRSVGRVFALASAISLLLCAATAIVWPISFWKSMGAQAQWITAAPNPDGEIPLECTIRLDVDRARVTLLWSRDYLSDTLDSSTGRLDPVSRIPVAFTLINQNITGGTPPGFVARRWADVELTQRYSDHVVKTHTTIAPLWAITALLGLLPAAYITLRRLRRMPPGHCPSCGYDLRASKDRCPECGTPITTKAGTKA